MSESSTSRDEGGGEGANRPTLFSYIVHLSLPNGLIKVAENYLLFLRDETVTNAVVSSTTTESFYKGSHHKKKRNGKNSLMGGGVNFFFSKKSQFQFGNIENPGGGSQFFKNV